MGIFSGVTDNTTLRTDLEARQLTTITNTACSRKNETTLDHWSNDPLFYIITVLMFYALSIIILMVKYIRREKQEAEFDNFYYEFVTRDKFQTPQFKNAQNMRNVLKSMQYKKLNMTDGADSDMEKEDRSDLEKLSQLENPQDRTKDKLVDNSNVNRQTAKIDCLDISNEDRSSVTLKSTDKEIDSVYNGSSPKQEHVS